MPDHIKSFIARVSKEADFQKFKRGFRAMAKIFDDREAKLVAELRRHTIASYKHYKLCRVCDHRWAHAEPESHHQDCILKGTADK